MLKGLCLDFLSKIFCVTVTKISSGSNSVFQKNSGVKKFYGQEREEGKEVLSKFSFKYFCLAAKKIRSGTLQCATNF